ncbi:MAG: hypothetical protein LAP40_25890 [Acidobacteriia bacterium]|nr:hypothetical protein [Terriglobia bacterium]
MRFFVQVSLCCLIAGGTAVAQRGARGSAGSVRMTAGSSMVRGGGFTNGAFRGRGMRPFNRGFYGVSFFAPGFYNYGFYPYNFGYSSYWPSSYDESAYDYAEPYATVPSSPNVTVYLPVQPLVAPPVAIQRARPVTREYDQNGLEIPTAASPQYLIAFTDHTIRLAASYRVDGTTLHYMTPEREDKQAPLDTVDRALSQQLNRERRVPFQLPPQ